MATASVGEPAVVLPATDGATGAGGASLATTVAMPAEVSACVTEVMGTCVDGKGGTSGCVPAVGGATMVSATRSVMVVPTKLLATEPVIGGVAGA